MEMMPMMMELEELPEQLPLPFQHLSDSSSLMEFSGRSSVTNHPTPQPQPQPQLFNYRHQSPPVTMPSPQMRMFPRGSWFQQKPDSVEAMREMIFRMAALQPVQIDPESLKAPKRRNVKISKDPQSVAARHRRERISERIRMLQRLVPGGTKMDTASMLDEAAHYMKFLKKQVQSLEQAAAASGGKISAPPGVNGSTSSMNQYSSNLVRACGQPSSQGSHMVGSMELLN